MTRKNAQEVMMPTENVKAAIGRANAVRDALGPQLNGDYADDERTTLTVAYLDASIEIHEGMMRLLQADLCAPAFALVRSIFEAMLRAHWIVGCASEEHVERAARKDDNVFPGMKNLAKDVDEKFGTDGFFIAIKENGWDAMNSFTHTGLLQLSRRFTGTRVEPSYSEGAILEAIAASTAYVLTLGILLARSTGRFEDANVVEKLLADYADSVRDDPAARQPAAPIEE